MSDVRPGQLNDDQFAVFSAVFTALCEHGNKNFFSLQGPGGTGKIFLYNCLYKYAVEQGKRVVRVASSGITSVLLPNGRMRCSTFGIPLDIQEE